MSSSVKKDTINKHWRGLPDPRPGSGLCPVAGPAALRGGGAGALQTQACSNRVHVISGGRGARLHGDHTKKEKQHNRKTRKNKNK